jgi:cellulose synthase/poly-beta-1,6-N-acetylglucosamine synthase-like glycosyltransferase
MVTPDQLAKAIAYQETTQGRIGWALITLGYVSRIDFFRVLSDHFGLPFRSDIEDVPKEVDYSLLSLVNHGEVIESQTIPYQLKEGHLVVLTAFPNSEGVLAFLKTRFGVHEVVQIVITDLDLTKITELLYRDILLEDSVYGLFFRKPQESAYSVFIGTQVVFFGLLSLGLLCWIYFSAISFILTLNIIIQLFYTMIFAFKLLVSVVGISREKHEVVSDAEVAALDEASLPVYSVLVPVYKEPEVIGILMDSLKKIDYPQNKLDIILLLESDDQETLAAARANKPPANWRFLVVPDSLPRTKPKACNYGLSFTRGKYLVIYDAEDMPEPNQLKKTVILFRKGGPQYICYQGALNYFNQRENLLTRLFTLEYSHWFDYLLPGMDRLRLVIPLGGTSNHFDTEKLKHLGGWDPFNTTEDADLGIRSYAEGYRVGVLNSTTYEESNAKVGSFIKQRSRWIKGYMQTWVVYSRHPIQLIKAMGLKGWLSLNLFIGGTPFAALINPITWAGFLIWVVTDTILFEAIFPPAVLYLSLFNLLFGNFLGIYLNMFAVFKRKEYTLLPYAILTPFYSILHSIAAYKALYQLFSQPFYWEKTQHGVTKLKINAETAENV